MDKQEVLTTIIENLTSSLQKAVAAADDARKTATHKENVAENRYDTLGLEAAYLAHGQSERVLELQNDLHRFVTLTERACGPTTFIEPGSLVLLQHPSGQCQHLFVGPARGGLAILLDDVRVTVVTPQSPIGSTLMGMQIDDVIDSAANEALNGSVVIDIS